MADCTGPILAILFISDFPSATFLGYFARLLAPRGFHSDATKLLDVRRANFGRKLPRFFRSCDASSWAARPGNVAIWRFLGAGARARRQGGFYESDKQQCKPAEIMDKDFPYVTGACDSGGVFGRRPTHGASRRSEGRSGIQGAGAASTWQFDCLSGSGFEELFHGGVPDSR